MKNKKVIDYYEENVLLDKEEVEKQKKNKQWARKKIEKIIENVKKIEKETGIKIDIGVDNELDNE